jgi:4-amino-4-deoxy-L-arabinose transferase-like glycosyltransferase
MSEPAAIAVAESVERGAARAHVAILAGILVVAALLRLCGLTCVPPGLNQDEATNAWNAWCLLHTGQDQSGQRWPIFYTHALGENRSTLFLYLLLPVQALGGLNVWTTRLPAAVGGVLTVLLLYWIVSRLFDRLTGLLGAALLALSPWHIVLSRFGHEASASPLLVAATLAALLWAGLPPRIADRPPVAWRGLLAGLLSGTACYGYPAIRLFLPPFIAGSVLVTAPAWLRLLRTRHERAAAAAFALGLGVTFGPLLYQHVAHPEVIARRAMSTGLWDAADPALVRVGKVLSRYAEHFGPDFLFMHGDRYELQGPRGFGVLQWYVLPPLLVGIAVCLARARRSAAARVLLVGLLAYPAGDCLYGHTSLSLHMLRSAPGMLGLTLLTAVGLAWAGRKLLRRRQLATVCVYISAAAALDARFLVYFFGEHARRPAVRDGFNADLAAACEWVRPRWGRADAVFITAAGFNVPYVVTLVGLGYDPQAWFREPRELRTYEGWEHYVRVGKLRFLYDPADLIAVMDLEKNDRADRVLLIVRPEEFQGPGPSEVIRTPGGYPALLLHELTL